MVLIQPSEQKSAIEVHDFTEHYSVLVALDGIRFLR